MNDKTNITDDLEIEDRCTTARHYAVRLTGETPLLMHSDDVSWAAQMDAWQADPENRKVSRAGDDRTPAYRWLGYCYHDRKHLGVPADNLMTMLREGGAKVPTGNRAGKGDQSFKKLSQSGILVNEIQWDLETPKGKVPWAALHKLVNEPDFAKHEEVTQSLGFSLFVKRARVGQTKHTRVRPRFDSWAASGTVTVLEDMITTDVLTSILEIAGRLCGLGDWRPSSPKSPGGFGRFSVAIEQIG
jgi:hypothetical protein